MSEQLPKTSDPAASDQLIRVLLVEDNHINQVVTAQSLRKLGCEVAICEDGRQALERVQCEPFDILFMDCQMPEMDGYDATRAIRAWEAEKHRDALPIVALTAHALAGDRQKCLDAGMDGYIPKPLPENALAQALLQWLPGKFLACEVPAGHAATPETRLPPPGVAMEAILTLEQLLGARALKLLEKFIVMTEASLQKMNRLVETGEAEAVAVAAHPMKSSSAQIGALRLSALLELIEVAGMKQQPESLIPLRKKINDEFQEVKNIIRYFIDQRK